jgi:hypothetical protein
MALPVSGAISFNDINVELGVAGTTQASLNQASYRTLAGVPSGEISLSDFYGKANEFNLVFSTNQTNINVATAATAAGWNGSAKLIVTINSGVYVGGSGAGSTAMTISGSFPEGLFVVNNGFIVGVGGAGGEGRSVFPGPFNAATGIGGSNGSSGGLALSVSAPVTLTNNGTIAGGGGGGGGGQAVRRDGTSQSGAGGGGGGGRSSHNNASGGSGGFNTAQGTGGGAGGAGTTASAGGGGAGGVGEVDNLIVFGGAGGGGGGYATTGSTGGSGSGNVTPQSIGGPFAGGAGGAAISGNSNITYIATGTRIGAIS